MEKNTILVKKITFRTF